VRNGNPIRLREIRLSGQTSFAPSAAQGCLWDITKTGIHAGNAGIPSLEKKQIKKHDSRNHSDYSRAHGDCIKKNAAYSSAYPVLSADPILSGYSFSLFVFILILKINNKNLVQKALN